MPDCPTCGGSFETRRGLGVHHSAAHDELLPNRECARCSDRFHSEHVFCSDDCQYAWLSGAFTGDGHPNWQGGTAATYGWGWRRVRVRALERDGYRCVNCGTSREELGRNPDVHHPVPVRAFVEHPVTIERDAHSLENVVSLCIECHRKAEFGHLPRERLRAAVR